MTINIKSNADRIAAREERITQLEARIRQLHDENKADREAVKKTVTPVYEYTFLPHTDTFEKIHDPEVVMYRLEGKCVNREELAAVGYTDRDLSDGGMNYLFNKATGRIIMSTGGGHIFISNPWGMKADKSRNYEAEAYAALERYVADFPEGGPVNDIIADHRAAKGQAF